MRTHYFLLIALFAQTGVADEVLSQDDAAAMLKISSAMMRSVAEENGLGREISGQWRFSRDQLYAWLAGGDRHEAKPKPEALPPSALGKVTGRGTDGQAPSNDPTKKPKDATATDIFLLDQGYTLKDSALLFEADGLYSTSEQTLVRNVKQLDDSVLAEASTQKQQVYNARLGLRYGLTDRLQVSAGMGFDSLSVSESVNSVKLNSASGAYFEPLTVGLHYSLLAEGLGYPGVVVGLEGMAPVDQGQWGVGSSLALTKSIDPVVLFATVAYRHGFGNPGQTMLAQPSDLFSGSVGLAFALNDAVSLSGRLTGMWAPKTNYGEFEIPSYTRYNLSLGGTFLIAKGLYLEPSVSFNLNGVDRYTAFGASVMYSY